MLRNPPASAEDASSIPGQVTHIPHATRQGQNIKDFLETFFLNKLHRSVPVDLSVE